MEVMVIYVWQCMAVYTHNGMPLCKLQVLAASCTPMVAV